MPTQRIEVVIDPSRARRGARQVERSLVGIETRADRLRTVLYRTFAFVSVGLIVREILQLSDSFINLENRARIASDSIGGEVMGTLNQLTAVAVRTRAPLLALAGVFQRGSIAADQLNASEEELIRLTEIAGKAVAIQGGGIQTARGALTQLSQSLGQTIVRGEEFNSILEGAFPIALAAARGIERVGGSIGRLRTEVIEGRVSSEEFFRGILRGGAEIDAQFALTVPTIGQAFVVLRTGLIRASEEVVNFSGPLAGFIRDIGLAIAVMSGVERQQIVTPEQEARVVSITASIEVLRVVALATAVVFAGRFVRALGAAFVQAQFTVSAVTSLRAGLSLLGGPTGVAFLAAFAIYEFVSSVRAQRAALRETVPELDSFRESLGRLTEAQLAVRGFEVADRLRETQDEIRRVEGQLDALNARFSQTVHLRSIGLRRGSETRFAAFQRDVAGFTADLDTLRGNAAAAEQQLEALAVARRAAQFVGPLLPEAEAPRPSREEPVDERAVTRAIQQLTRLRQTADDDIAAAALSRIDRVTRAEQQANETIDRLISERLVTEQQAETTRAAVGVQAALQRQQIIEDQAEGEREIEQERLERVRERNTEAVAEIRRQLTALQPSYDQAVIAAIEWADETIAGLDRQDAAFERNAETVRDVLNARIRLIRDERDAEAQADSVQDVRARQEIALEHARTLLQIQQRLVSVGLASRDAGVEAELWAQSVRDAIDRTAEGADEALRAIDEIVERQRQLASNDPLVGIRVGLETYANQLPTVAEQINMAVQNTLSETEGAIVSFVQTGKLSFSSLVDSILADLAPDRIASSDPRSVNAGPQWSAWRRFWRLGWIKHCLANY